MSADTIEKWGSKPLSEVLEPAAALAEEGFPVSPVTAYVHFRLPVACCWCSASPNCWRVGCDSCLCFLYVADLLGTVASRNFAWVPTQTYVVHVAVCWNEHLHRWCGAGERLCAMPDAALVCVLSRVLQEMLIDGRAPKAGELFHNPNLARTFRELGKHGKAGFYSGRIAKEIVKVVAGKGGAMSEQVGACCLKAWVPSFLDSPFIPVSRLPRVPLSGSC